VTSTPPTTTPRTHHEPKRQWYTSKAWTDRHIINTAYVALSTERLHNHRLWHSAASLCQSFCPYTRVSSAWPACFQHRQLKHLYDLRIVVNCSFRGSGYQLTEAMLLNTQVNYLEHSFKRF